MSASSAAVASRFGQRLAHTEKKYRDQALKKLTAYLGCKREWSALEWDKLWKALFYCMWMSDKRPVQMELARNLARLVHTIPSRREALAFVRSFFRTMRREWHGLDGLRLDKFYDLVRQFVRESVALLAAHKFARASVSELVDILSAEVVSQRPNGLRMHLADLYLAEICSAAGEQVETGAFLLLLEPFFTLLGSEYDQTVFKRARDLVFLPMLSEFLFGEAAKEAMEAAEKKKSDDETDGDDEGEEESVPRGFPRVDLARVQHRIFAIAAAEDTAERNRAALYDLYGKFAAVTEVDSLKVAQEEALNPKKDDEEEEEEDAEMEEATEEKAASEDKQKKKKKKSKKRKQADVLEQEQEEEKEVSKATEAAPPSKKPKKQTEETKETSSPPQEEEAQDKKKKKAKKAKKQVEEPAETPSEKQKQPEEEKVPTDDKPKKKKAKKNVETEPTEKKAKEEKKVEKQAKEEDKPAVKKAKEEKKVEKKVEEKPKEEKKKKKLAVVVKSGVKFQRCASCGGFGKNLLRAGKDMCGHCERTKKTQKKASAKKRKAEDQRAAEDADAAAAAAAKKVTFGKNKALPHSLSVKRLKASAKKDAVPKDTDIKGVLKASATPPAVKKSKKQQRKTAADFF